MTKVLKIAAKTIGATFEWLLILIIAFVFLIRSYPVQTYLAHQATAFLSKELNTKVEIGRVEIIFLNQVLLKDVLILDLKKDSILYSKEIFVKIDKLNLAKNEFVLAQTELNTGSININRDKKSGNYNYQFIADYFSGESKSESKPATLIFQNIAISNFNLKYDDFRKSQLEYGLDYDHIKIQDLALHVSDLQIKDDVLALNLNKLKLKEQCGLNIQQLRSKIIIASNGIRLQRFHLRTKKTKLNCPKLNLLFNDWGDFDQFEDRVKFDIKIEPSRVSLSDVSIFAPDIEGMDADVLIKGNASKLLRNLSISDLDLRFGKKSIIQGDFILPDFRKEGLAKLNENVNYAYLDFEDLRRFHLPKGNGSISIDDPVSKFSYAQIINLKTRGNLNNFNLIFNKLNTNIGSFSLNNFLAINTINDTTIFKPVLSDSTLFTVRDFNLSTFIENQNFGIVDGEINLQGKISNDGEVELSNIIAQLKRFDFSDYSYSSIAIKDGSLKDDIVQAKMTISDPNLALTYDGRISIGQKQVYDVDLNVEKALLTKLGLTSTDNISLSSQITCQLEGASLNRLKGSISSNHLSYQEDSNNLFIPQFKLDIERTEQSDFYNLKSSILNANISGKINYETVIADFLSELAVVFPSINNSKKQHIKNGNSDIRFDFTTGNSDEFLAIFVPYLKVSPNSKLIGSYNSSQSNLQADLTSELIEYQDLKFKKLACNQRISKIGITGTYQLDEIKYGDSLKFENVLFTANGMAGIVNSKLTWDPNTKDFSSIDWQTIVLDNNLLNFQIHPSFFSLNGLQWKIEKESEITLSPEDIHVSNLKLARNGQQIFINGCLSGNNSDKLKLDIDNFNLKELSQILGLPTEISGNFSGWGEISNPYTNFNYKGDARIENFKVNKEEIGNIQLMSDWNQKRESVIIKGDLEYKNLRTFDFSGLYDITADNLDLFLNFENTDIAFANAFMDPSVVKNIGGKVNGKIRVKGNPAEPKLNGNLKLSQGTALVELLGVKYTIDGTIKVEEDAFLIDPIPIRDEDGNTASLVGAVNHYNFDKWNFDLQFNFEDDLFKRPQAGGKAVPLEQFMVLKTKYKDGDIYYGTAYARGYANIEGTESNLSITVEAETKQNTQIYFPMYGVSELDESEDFVTIIDKSIKNNNVKEKIDLSGIDLDMKFKVNQNAKMNLIFNDITNDEITATGKGDINLKLDQMDNVFLEGTYTISEGSKYNFTMAGIQQPFEIEKGSTIKWSGSPYNADININTYVNLKKVSILELSPELMDNSLLNQEVNCYLKLDETLLKPQISFDIRAPRAPETGKALIRRVTSDNDELNRQFFSLLIARKFQPLKGTISASSSAAIDLVESQINAALNNLTDSYKLNVDYGEEKTMGEKSFEVGFKKGLLNDRLIISSSIGVESKNLTSETGSVEGGSSSSSNGNGASKSNALIGDVNIEYIINEKGTFRANIFNKSNTNSINEQAGPFTQGAGISYLEEFNNWNDFELVQYGLDIFRKEDKKKYKKKKKKTKIPSEFLNNSSVGSSSNKKERKKN
jgi:hypothetical protein